MAGHRMIKASIIGAAKFIKMPASCRLLYYDLILRADDDGVVEAFNVMRLTGASEDDLRILFAKGFVTVLNEDLVTYIQNWREHNTIRADRKVDSIYKDLLVQVVPDIELVESRQRTDVKPKIEMSEEEKQAKILEKEALNKAVEYLWSIYPNKKGKQDAIKKLPKLIEKYGVETLEKCVMRYADEIKAKNTEQQYQLYGSTFFNGKFVDYLDENYGGASYGISGSSGVENSTNDGKQRTRAELLQMQLANNDSDNGENR